MKTDSDAKEQVVKWTVAAAALLMVGQAWAQDTAVAPEASGEGPADRPSKNIALAASYTLEPTHIARYVVWPRGTGWGLARCRKDDPR